MEDVEIDKFPQTSLVLRNMSSPPTPENLNWKLSDSNVSHFSWGRERQVMTLTSAISWLPHPWVKQQPCSPCHPQTSRGPRPPVSIWQAASPNGLVPVGFLWGEKQRGPQLLPPDKEAPPPYLRPGHPPRTSAPSCLVAGDAPAWLRILPVPSLQGELKTFFFNLYLW